jgi:large subunit ribosomal protein L23
MILKRPLVTEKVSALNESGVYGFVVDKTANKVEIKKAIEQLYGVTVEGIRTMRYQGKSKTRQTKSKIIAGRTPSFKKAYVKVKEGDVIDFYSGV